MERSLRIYEGNPPPTDDDDDDSGGDDDEDDANNNKRNKKNKTTKSRGNRTTFISNKGRGKEDTRSEAADTGGGREAGWQRTRAGRPGREDTCNRAVTNILQREDEPCMSRSDD